MKIYFNANLERFTKFLNHETLKHYVCSPGKVGRSTNLSLSINLSLSQEQRDDVTNSKRAVGGFKVGMKLEAKDRLHPTLMCVATITDIKDEQLLIHFDGWSMDYDYWCRPDSTDIHPRGWCSSRGMELQAPAGIDHFMSVWLPW